MQNETDNQTPESDDDFEDSFDKILQSFTKSPKQDEKKKKSKDQEYAELERELEILIKENCPTSTPAFKIDYVPLTEDEYTFESMFGVEAKDPFVRQFDISVVPAPDHTKASIVTRQVQAYYEGQKRMKVPTLPVDRSAFETLSIDRAIYCKRNNEYWESVLVHLGLDNAEHIKYIMKPDFCDVLPQLLNKFKNGQIPTVDTTWTIAPRLNPVNVYEDLAKSAEFCDVFPDVERDQAAGILSFKHSSLPRTFVYKTGNNRDVEEKAFRRMLIYLNKKLGGKMENIVRNLKTCSVAMVQSRNLPRLLGEDDHFIEYSRELNQLLYGIRDRDVVSEHGNLYKELLRAKQFRYAYEDRTKENLYYSHSPRSSYYRYEFFMPSPTVKMIAIFSPDKRLTHASIGPLISDGPYQVDYYSDLALAEHGSSPTIYRKRVRVESVNAFYKLTKAQLDLYDVIYCDFVEVKVIGKMLFGSYCQNNIIVRSIQDRGYNGRIVARLGFSPEYPVAKGYCLANVSLFKAGGLEYIGDIRRAANSENWNRIIYLKLMAVKRFVEYSRRHALLSGFSLSCHDFKRPVRDDIRWTVPESAFCLSGSQFKPFAYQHTRQSNKFTVRSEDFLDNWVNLSRQKQDPQDRIYTSAILHSNFDLSAAESLLDTMQCPNSRGKLRSVMRQMVRMNELPRNLLRAIQTCITVPKSYSYLKKKCPNIDDYSSLFEEIGSEDDPLWRFVGAHEMIHEIRTLYDINMATGK